MLYLCTRRQSISVIVLGASEGQHRVYSGYNTVGEGHRAGSRWRPVLSVQWVPYSLKHNIRSISHKTVTHHLPLHFGKQTPSPYPSTTSVTPPQSLPAVRSQSFPVYSACDLEGRYHVRDGGCREGGGGWEMGVRDQTCWPNLQHWHTTPTLLLPVIMTTFTEQQWQPATRK